MLLKKYMREQVKLALSIEMYEEYLNATGIHNPRLSDLIIYFIETYGKDFADEHQHELDLD